MNRRRFTGLTAALAVASPTLLKARQPKRVIVVGAGAAGVTAAYHLIRAGVDVTIFEASGRWGGRVMRLADFADVPLDLGAEWIHDDPSILGEIIGEGPDTLGIETLEYRPETYKFWHKNKLRDFNLLRHAYAEVKFLDTTWHGFFERFLYPEIQHSIQLNAPVTAIDLTGEGVVVRLQNGKSVDADSVLVTVPISMLQRGQVAFSSDELIARLEGLRDVQFGVGFKVFLKFRERFYPDMLLEGSRLGALSDSWNAKTYYDAAFGKPTDENILGLFTAWDTAIPRAQMSHRELIEDVLTELEAMFGTVVRETLIGARAQNWTLEPFIAGSYSMTNDSRSDIEEILAPFGNTVHFAGEALGGEAQSTVHGAAFSAITAVEHLLSS